MKLVVAFRLDIKSVHLLFQGIFMEIFEFRNLRDSNLAAMQTTNPTLPPTTLHEAVNYSFLAEDLNKSMIYLF